MAAKRFIVWFLSISDSPESNPGIRLRLAGPAVRYYKLIQQMQIEYRKLFQRVASQAYSMDTVKLAGKDG